MSLWTHIVAVLDVDTYIIGNNICDIVINQLKNAPKITGSEGNADIFVNSLSDYNHHFSSDCEHCKYKDTIIHYKEGGFSCDAEAEFNCPEGKYQSRITITIVGDLRDREKERTKQEYNEFYKYIKILDYEIRNKTVNIIGY
jgi:hypothetical protein